jgi:hypothetical protein
MLRVVECVDKIPHILKTAELAIFFDFRPEWRGEKRRRRKTQLFGQVFELRMAEE